MKTTYTEEGFWQEARPYSTEGKWCINYSTILTKLIQTAGKYCKRYASDLFYDWMTIDRKLNEGKEFDETFIFGFRDDGVDSKIQYETRKENAAIYGEPYHEVWELKITTDIKERDITMELNLIEN